MVLALGGCGGASGAGEGGTGCSAAWRDGDGDAAWVGSCARKLSIVICCVGSRLRLRGGRAALAFDAGAACAFVRGGGGAALGVPGGEAIAGSARSAGVRTRWSCTRLRGSIRAESSARAGAS